MTRSAMGPRVSRILNRPKNVQRWRRCLSRSWSTRKGREDGAILILALGFLILAGSLVASLLALAGPSFVTTSVVQNVQNAITAADAGVQYGIQTLRTGVIPPNTTTNPANSIPCSFGGTSATFGGVPSIDGETGDSGVGPQPPNTLRVICSVATSGGSSAGGIGWAVIANDPSPSAITDKSGGTKSIVGPVYNAGGWSLQTQMTVKDGNVYTAASSCTNPIANLVVSPSPPFGQQCVSPSNPIPDVAHALPSAGPPAAVAPTSVTTTGGCTTFVPGTYAPSNFSGTTFNQDLSGNAYFESGTYYLNNLGNLSVGKSLFGGQPAPGESQVTTNATACATDPANWASTNGEGVELILGGNTSISVGNNSTMELYTRTQCVTCQDGSSPDITLYQVPPGSTGGWNASTLSNATDFLTVGNGANVAAVIHGAVYAPSGSVVLFATNSSQAVTFGGIDAWDVTMKSSASASGLITSIAITPGQRTLSISASATLSSGRVITAIAVVQIANDAARTATIDSWQVNQ